MHLDWYQATIPAFYGDIRDAVMALDLVHSCEPQDRGGRGYKSSIRFADRGGDSHLVLFHGSKSASPSLQASGEWSEPLAALVRSEFPKHSVSRVDVAQDFVEKGGFARARRTLGRISKANRVKTGWSYVPREPEKGRTFYAGSPTSAAMARCYEKGKELLQKGKVTADQFNPDHYRVEFQLRPNKSEEKALFAILEPQAMLGYSSWVREASLALFKVDHIPSLDRLRHEAAEVDHAFAYMATQFRGMLLRKATADNNRFVGLAEPTHDELFDLMAERLKAIVVPLWEEDARSRREDRDPLREIRAAAAQKTAIPF